MLVNSRQLPVIKVKCAVTVQDNEIYCFDTDKFIAVYRYSWFQGLNMG